MTLWGRTVLTDMEMAAQACSEMFTITLIYVYKLLTDKKSTQRVIAIEVAQAPVIAMAPRAMSIAA